MFLFPSPVELGVCPAGHNFNRDVRVTEHLNPRHPWIRTEGDTLAPTQHTPGRGCHWDWFRVGELVVPLRVTSRGRVRPVRTRDVCTLPSRPGTAGGDPSTGGTPGPTTRLVRPSDRGSAPTHIRTRVSHHPNPRTTGPPLELHVPCATRPLGVPHRGVGRGHPYPHDRDVTAQSPDFFDFWTQTPFQNKEGHRRREDATCTVDPNSPRRLVGTSLRRLLINRPRGGQTGVLTVRRTSRGALLRGRGTGRGTSSRRVRTPRGRDPGFDVRPTVLGRNPSTSTPTSPGPMTVRVRSQCRKCVGRTPRPGRKGRRR